MNLAELKQKLDEAGVNEDYYSLNEGYGFPPDKMCINYTKRLGWHVFFSEKGDALESKWFKTEDEACNYFYEQMIKSVS